VTRRYAAAVAGAAVVTFGLFLLMQSLIAMDLDQGVQEVVNTPIEIVRVERESDTQRKRRLPQQAQPKDRPPPPPIRAATAPKPRTGTGMGQPVYLPDFAMAGGPGLGASPSDTDVSPLVRVPPQYPPRAQERGIEGWVLVEFSISKTGTVADPVVIDADPPSTFNRAALRAVRKWKYRPRVQNGQPVERHGVQTVIRFDLDG
jgi:protein TonB